MSVNASSDPLALWQQMVAVAIVGAERQSVDISAATQALGDIPKLQDGLAPEQQFLSAASMLSLYVKAGRMPEQTAVAVVTPCELDDLPAADGISYTHLMTMLKGEFEEALPEWLYAVTAAGRRAPDASLPALLDYGRKKAGMRGSILSVLGKRGKWLAAQNPDWDYSTVALDEDIWQVGSREQRCAFLASLRETQPGRAREMLASTWEQETPEDKAAFLKTFVTGLSTEDEPFLEHALDDRRKEVRKAAAEALCRLPGSRLATQMISRIGPLLSYAQESRFLLGGQKAKIQVTLPGACDKEMERDGIEPKAPQGTGQKSWWLMQMLAKVPPSHWCKTWNSSPEDILRAAIKSEEKSALLTAFIEAAARYQDPDWAEAMLKMLDDKLLQEHFTELMAILPSGQRLSLVKSCLPSQRGVDLLCMCGCPLDADLSRAALESYAATIKAGGRWSDWEVRERGRTLRDFFAYHISPSMYPEAEKRLTHLADADSRWANTIDEFLSILRFRHEALGALKHDT